MRGVLFIVSQKREGHGHQRAGKLRERIKKSSVPMRRRPSGGFGVEDIGFALQVTRYGLWNRLRISKNGGEEGIEGYISEEPPTHCEE